MKLIGIVMAILILGTCEQKSSEMLSIVQSITYTAQTRGSSYICTIDNRKLQLTTNGIGSFEKSKEITKTQWLGILKDLEEVALDSLNKLEVPNEKSSTDRARIATLVVHSTNGIYESMPFDEGNPPRSLLPLINNMLALAQTVD